MKYLLVILVAALIVALPFVFRKPTDLGDWHEGDPVLVVITPHNEAIRYEFAEAFSRWHRAQYNRPVKVDWRSIGGTTEIMRYLAAEYVSSMKRDWKTRGETWPLDGGAIMLDRSFNPATPPPAALSNDTARSRFEQQKKLYVAFRSVDDPGAVSCGVDLFFGGGTFDHNNAARQGLTVPAWSAEERKSPEVAALLNAFPAQLGDEPWRSDTFFGTVLSSFGICCNPERLRDFGVTNPPVAWRDLADPRLFGQVGLADPTKSGSVAKAYEMIIHEQCWRAVLDAGFSREQVASNETAIAKARLPPGQLPPGVPAEYQAALERGWLEGVNLLRRIGANAHYFTDSAGKVTVDVNAGVVATGVAIDFYGRFQAETERAPDGREHMTYLTPAGGSSVSADPVSLLRGAPHRALAVRFIAFCLSPEGQKLWNYRPGTPGGPKQFALRRLPIRRDFYPSDDPAGKAECWNAGMLDSCGKTSGTLAPQQTVVVDPRPGVPALSNTSVTVSPPSIPALQPSSIPCKVDRSYLSDDLSDPRINPYALAAQFTYQPRWSGSHFGLQRDLVRAMCLDSGDELRAAWKAILDHGGPDQNPRAMALLLAMPDCPVPLTWRSAITDYKSIDRLACLREWTAFFRQNYRKAQAAAGGK